MWICFEDCFVSVAESDEGAAAFPTLVVRARRRGDLVRLLGPGAEIVAGEAAGYRYRAVVPRAELARIVAARMAGIDYPDLGWAVRDPDLAQLYADFETDHARFAEAAETGWHLALGPGEGVFEPREG